MDLDESAIGLSEREKKESCDQMVDLHYLLAKASVLMRACSALEVASHGEMGAVNTALVTCMQDATSACMDTTRLLMMPQAGILGSFAALPSIYHFWIGGCLVFLLRLCQPDRRLCQIDILVEGQQRDILGAISTFMQHYISDLSTCDTAILVEDPPIEIDEPRYETLKHPAMESALAIAEMLASVQATA